jgi:hypothetical protein
MENLFAYGSLRKKEVQTVFGRIKGVPEKLLGYRNKRIEIEEFGLENYQLSLLPKMIQTALKE